MSLNSRKEDVSRKGKWSAVSRGAPRPSKKIIKGGLSLAEEMMSSEA